ncbi:AbrB/MazE/SpoVT family DNA-binding domain-containing protein [Neobacillus pocheonensis]|uniref:AbrB/MazE/SpoVT family DNA-binding domain-containing protein n=1 Tax=Neobacillus pocheonensis TaxID=363869 RepID=UPI003D2DCE4C
MGGVRRIKPTGIVREVDELGRVVLPMELRRTMGIGRKDAVEISVEGNWVVIQPYKQFCHFCGSDKDISPFKGKYICETCVGDLFDNVDVNV